MSSYLGQWGWGRGMAGGREGEEGGDRWGGDEKHKPIKSRRSNKAYR